MRRLRSMRILVASVWLVVGCYLTWLSPKAMLTFLLIIGALAFLVFTAIVFSALEKD